MRRDYKYLYQAAPISIVRPTENYDPERTYMERRATASRLAKQQANVRCAKTAEFWIELIVPSLLALVMLPVLWVVGIIMLARALWRRYVRGHGRQRAGDNRLRSVCRRPVPSWRIERTWGGRQHRARGECAHVDRGAGPACRRRGVARGGYTGPSYRHPVTPVHEQRPRRLAALAGARGRGETAASAGVGPCAPATR